MSETEKYDRQVRLWGEEAQQRLERAHICVVTASATGSEVLKNLVLPGVGSFTVVDSARVEQSDLGTNFFVSPDDVGRPRAEAVTGALLELNGRVRGASVTGDGALSQFGPDFWKQFTVVVATQLPESALSRLSSALASAGSAVPLVAVRSYGLVGYVRVCASPDHYVRETRPDTPVIDLRLANPFPALAEYAATFDLPTLDSAQHSHVPYVVLLVQAAKAWREAHGGKLPTTRDERDAFKASVRSAARNASNELNFQEALAASHRACSVAAIPGDVLDLLADPRCDHPPVGCDDFWVLCAALKGYIKNEGGGLLPLQGCLPDMVAHTEVFVRLQKIYMEKADADASAVACRVDAITEKAKRPRIDTSVVKTFCRNAAFMKLVKYRPIEGSASSAARQPQSPSMGPALSSSDDPADPLPWLFMIHAADSFKAKFGRFPGSYDDEVEGDIKNLRDVTNSILAARGIPACAVKDDVVHELSRFGGVELHNVAAVLGGIAAQEVIKLVTHCFVPIDNTIVFNGMTCSSKTYSL